MSRNIEKAQSALNRFQSYKNKEAGVLETNPSLRPKYVQSVESLPQAEKWRSTVIGEISNKLTRIQDPALNEYQIRDLNDSLNKLFNEKRAWEYHIRDLGGNDYITFNKDFNKIGKIDIDSAGVKLKGYRYFGRAKELSDVKEILIAQQRQKSSRKSRQDKEQEEQKKFKERVERIKTSYYGFYDETSNANSTINTKERDIINQINEIVGDEVIEPLDDINQNYNSVSDLDDNLIEFEQERNRELSKMYRDAKNETSSNNPIADFETTVPTNDQISKWIVHKKREELKAKLGIKN